MYRIAIAIRVQKKGKNMNDRQCSSFLITLPALQKQQCKQLLLCSTPNLLNILLKKYYTIITTNTSCFDYFHSYCKASLQIHCLNVRKKWTLRWSDFKEVRIEIKLFTSTWYTALLLPCLLCVSSLWFWLGTQPGFSFPVQSHTWSKSESPLGSEEVKMQTMDLIQFLNKAIERLCLI